MKGPLDGSYWVEPERLLIGGYPGSVNRAITERRLEALLDCGVRTCLSLMEEDPRGLVAYAGALAEQAARRGLRCSCLCYPIEDCSVPSTEQMDTIVAALEEGLTRGAVYAHCWGGRGRAGIVAGVWLIRTGRATPASFVDVIGGLRGRDPRSYPSPETAEQIEFVRRYGS